MSVAVNSPKTPEASSGIAAATLPNVCNMPGPPAPFVAAPLPTWAAATAMGAYPVAPELPRDCGVAIDPEIPIIDNELEWGLSQFRADPDALLGLINALAVISREVCPIDEARIE